MSDAVRTITVKLHPVGRAQTFAVDGRPDEVLPRPGQRVVVQSEAGAAVGTVVPTIPALAAWRRLPADTPQRMVRLATHEDIVARQRQQQREKDAYRIAMLKIRERGLSMKLTRVEQSFDGTRLLFYFTAESRV